MSGAAARPPERGRVVAAYGRRTLVETSDGSVLSCVARGRRSGIACGDWVHVCRIAGGDGVVEEIEPRTSLVYRSDAKREKLIAANVTQIVVVLAVAPAPNADFLDRCLVAAEHAGARSLLVLNKTDLSGPGDAASRIADAYRDLGYRTLPMSIHTPATALLEALAGHVSVFIGQSGVGKSTLVNRLVPAAQARVAATSAAANTGRHTTTHAQLYRLGTDTAVIDSPGMHAFGLSHVAPEDLASCFVEFRGFLGRCRFSNCRHDGEPECALAAAADDAGLRPERLSSYRRLLHSLDSGAAAR